MISITVRLNAALSNEAGQSRWSLTLAAGATAGTLLERLCAEHPDLSQQLANAVMVISGRIVDRSEPLHEGQEVAFLTPISGG